MTDALGSPTAELPPMTFTAGQLKMMLLHYWMMEPPKSVAGAGIHLEQTIYQEHMRQKREVS